MLYRVRHKVYSAMMVELYEVSYGWEPGTGDREGLAYWRLSGIAIGHPRFPNGSRVLVAEPRDFDKQTKVLTTASGRQYCFKSWGDDPRSIVVQILKDIQTGGFESQLV